MIKYNGINPRAMAGADMDREILLRETTPGMRASLRKELLQGIQGGKD